MIIVLPIGHESNTVRRLPWITFSIMAICLVVQILLSVEAKKKAEKVQIAALRLVEYYFAHPYLELDAEAKVMLFGERYAEEFEKKLSLLRRSTGDEIHLFIEEQQAELDQLSKKFKDAVNDIPYRKWGFIPANKSFIGLLTYMFVHSGWLHLIGNLLFLYLTGPFIEDVWGRTIFSAFYLAMGVFSALMFAQHYPSLNGPLVGASGAIAGVMGAFLIRYWNTKIEFFYFFFVFIRGTFKAPAWLMMPLWVGLEFFNARSMDAVNPGGGGSVAHWVHVWGFVFGVAVAVTMKILRIEEKFIHPKIEAQIQYVDEGFKTVEEAVLKKQAGMYEEAFVLLVDAARKGPVRSDVMEELWSLGVEMGREDESAKYFIMLIEKEIRRNQMDAALKHFRSLKEILPQASISPTCKIALIEYLVRKEEVDEAKELASELLEEVDLNSSPGLLLNFARIALKLSPQAARRIIALCLQHPEIPEDQKERLKAEFE